MKKETKEFLKKVETDISTEIEKMQTGTAGGPGTVPEEPTDTYGVDCPAGGGPGIQVEELTVGERLEKANGLEVKKLAKALLTDTSAEDRIAKLYEYGEADFLWKLLGEFDEYSTEVSGYLRSFTLNLWNDLHLKSKKDSESYFAHKTTKDAEILAKQVIDKNKGKSG